MACIAAGVHALAKALRAAQSSVEPSHDKCSRCIGMEARLFIASNNFAPYRNAELNKHTTPSANPDLVVKHQQ